MEGKRERGRERYMGNRGGMGIGTSKYTKPKYATSKRNTSKHGISIINHSIRRNHSPDADQMPPFPRTRGPRRRRKSLYALVLYPFPSIPREVRWCRGVGSFPRFSLSFRNARHPAWPSFLLFFRLASRESRYARSMRDQTRTLVSIGGGWDGPINRSFVLTSLLSPAPKKLSNGVPSAREPGSEVGVTT